MNVFCKGGLSEMHMRRITKALLATGMLLGLSTAAIAQNISNARDANGNFIRRNVPMNNTQPMINSTANNPARRAPNAAPTADQNLAPTSDEVSRFLGYRK
jgi:hypothetical protein